MKLNSIKKITAVIAAVLCFGSAFAEIDVSMKASGGTLFEYGEITLPLLPETGIEASYSFDLPNGAKLSAGAGLNVFIIPAAYLSADYCFCLNPESEKNYRWNLEAGLDAGVSWFGNDYYIEETDEYGADWLIMPVFTLSGIFTFKPVKHGVYFGAGPSVCMVIIPYSDETVFSLITGITLKMGYKF